MGVPLPLLAVYTIVFFAGLLLFSGRPRLGLRRGPLRCRLRSDGRRLLLAAGRADLGFVMFAVAAVLGTVMMTLAGLLIGRLPSKPVSASA